MDRLSHTGAADALDSPILLSLDMTHQVDLRVVNSIDSHTLQSSCCLGRNDLPNL